MTAMASRSALVSETEVRGAEEVAGATKAEAAVSERAIRSFLRSGAR